ncbi:MAG: hypothetical protein AAGA50_03485 [Pseudomonadota bacterium]
MFGATTLLRYRLPQFSLVYAVYWTTCAVFAGMLLGPVILSSKPVPEEDHTLHFTHDHNMAHGKLEVSPLAAPEISLAITRDKVSGWNVAIQTKNFEFKPGAVNGPARDNEGHAHLYINGEKQARIYGTSFHLTDLPPGVHEVKVTLNAHDHSVFAIAGEEIAASATIVQNP